MTSAFGPPPCPLHCEKCGGDTPVSYIGEGGGFVGAEEVETPLAGWLCATCRADHFMNTWGHVPPLSDTSENKEEKSASYSPAKIEQQKRVAKNRANRQRQKKQKQKIRRKK